MIAAYAFAETSTFGVRADLSYPLGRQHPAFFTIRVLFGCGVLRNEPPQ